MTWSKRHACCRYCKTTELRHKGRGLCTYCHREIWRYVNGPKKDQEMAPFFRAVYAGVLSAWRAE